jgi:hypothetical protein
MMVSLVVLLLNLVRKRNRKKKSDKTLNYLKITLRKKGRLLKFSSRKRKLLVNTEKQTITKIQKS